MRKKLLFVALAMTCALSSFALEEGDYAFTKSGRVKITGQNLFETGSTNLEGWTSATGDAVNNEVWATEPGVGENGEDAIQSQGVTEDEAITRVFSLPAGQYVVSYQIRATGETASGTTTVGATIGNNYMGIFLNTDAATSMVESSPEALVSGISAAENFDEQWKTVNYLFEVSDSTGAPQNLVFHIERMVAGVQITNFSVNEAMEVYDIRIIQNKIAFAKQLLVDPNFNTAAAADAQAYLMNDVIPMIEGMIDANALDETATAEDILSAFDQSLSDYLDASSINIAQNTYFNYVEDIRTVPSSNRGSITNGQKVGGFVLRGNNWFHQRGMDAEGKRTLLDNPYWTKYIGYGNENGPGSIGLWNDKMPAGKYYIAAVMRNCTEVRAGKVWDLECAVKAFVGSDSVDCGTIKGEDFVKFYFVGELKQGESFEAGFYWDGPLSGSTFQIGEFEIRSFQDIQSYVEHLTAWETFIAQYNAMVNARNQVVSMKGKKDYPWNQAVLTEALEKYDPYYNAIISKGWVTSDGQDAGIATTEELNEWARYQGVEEYSEPEGEGEPTRLEYQVVRGYQNAANAVVESNKPIADLLAAINNAKSSRNNPKNVNADKTIIDPAIEAASDLYKEIYANTNDDRRDTDVANIESMLQALAESVASFEATADVKPFIDIDFSLGVTSNDETGFFEANGNPGTMVFSNYEIDNASNSVFSLGTGDALMDVLRVGKGTATVDFDAPDDNDIVEVNFDLWVGNLVRRNIWIDLKNADGVRVAGFKLNRYDANVEYNDFNDVIGTSNGGTGMDIRQFVSGVGRSGQENGVICVDNNKSSFTLIIDYSSKTLKGKVVNGTNGTSEGAEFPINPELEDNKIVKFELGSDYDNVNRRSFFDNLKITKYKAIAGIQGDVNGDEAVDVSDISSILTVMASGGTDAAADVNGDGIVDVADISTVLTIMASM